MFRKAWRSRYTGRITWRTSCSWFKSSSSRRSQSLKRSASDMTTNTLSSMTRFIRLYSIKTVRSGSYCCSMTRREGMLMTWRRRWRSWVGRCLFKNGGWERHSLRETMRDARLFVLDKWIQENDVCIEEDYWQQPGAQPHARDDAAPTMWLILRRNSEQHVRTITPDDDSQEDPDKQWQVEQGHEEGGPRHLQLAAVARGIFETRTNRRFEVVHFWRSVPVGADDRDRGGAVHGKGSCED